jgi:acyl-CoA thioesterase FadM
MMNMTDDKIEKVRITSRGYELAASGTLSIATYLRYFEHMRWHTISTSEKLPLRRFWMLGVVRAQTVEVYKSVGFDVELELTMWLARVGRSSMDFSHDMVRVSDGALVARSTATIVALDSTRKPAAIGEGAREYLVTKEVISPERLEGAPPADAWERTVDLRPSDHDLQQHVNHARYAELVDDTRLLCARVSGYGSGDWDGRVRRFSIAYEQEARLGDTVVARTWRTRARDRCLDFLLTKSSTVVVTRARIELLAPRSPSQL